MPKDVDSDAEHVHEKFIAMRLEESVRHVLDELQKHVEFTETLSPRLRADFSLSLRQIKSDHLRLKVLVHFVLVDSSLFGILTLFRLVERKYLLEVG